MPRPRKAINQINVVPYIDVMLVLLIIFMVTAPLITPGEITLPSVGSAADAAVFADRDHIKHRPVAAPQEGSPPPIRVSRDELIARMRELQAKNADQAVVIAANKLSTIRGRDRPCSTCCNVTAYARWDCSPASSQADRRCGRRARNRSWSTGQWIAAILAIAVHVAFIVFLICQRDLAESSSRAGKRRAVRAASERSRESWNRRGPSRNHRSQNRNLRSRNPSRRSRA